jgi:hypothetical protein
VESINPASLCSIAHLARSRFGNLHLARTV